MDEIRTYATFEELEKHYNEFMREAEYKPSMITYSGYGDKRMVGVAACGMDDGDVEVHAVFDTENEKARVLAEVNRKAEIVIADNKDSSWPIELGEFFTEYVNHSFDTFYFSASLWG